MDGLFFEVLPKQGHVDHYFRQVDLLRPALARHEGLLWIDRYRSRSRDGALLSHQLWQDEAAITRWRRDPMHRKSQSAGRNRHFADYRIRIGHLLGETGVEDDAALPLDVRAGTALIVAVESGAPSDDQAPRTGPGERFSSVNHPDSDMTLIAAGDAPSLRHAIVSARGLPAFRRARVFAIYRDYGMSDRLQAPPDE
ncbi:antibiotic biosynthesis monooxygenase [Brevirhabdus sp.]|uniref:antibiotic biosynthesis monooxygenase n=1 Tax=Brevirhabdus sp. TaxID=2004514 RepID=UPI004057E056